MTSKYSYDILSYILVHVIYFFSQELAKPDLKNNAQHVNTNDVVDD
jgi:hypothetical protein